MGFIMDKTISTFKDALLRFAPSDMDGKISYPERVQIIIATKDNETCDPYYRVLNDFKPVENKKPKKGFISGEFTIEQLQGIRIDLTGGGMFAKKFLKDNISKFATEIGIEPKKVVLMVTTSVEAEGFPVPVLYKYGEKEIEKVRQLEWKGDIFKDEAEANVDDFK
jgi:hypothetical protein